MNFVVVRYVLGRLCLFLSALLCLPLVFAIVDHGNAGSTTMSFAVAVVLALVPGVLSLRSKLPEGATIGANEGFACVTLCWTLAGLLGAVPFWLGGEHGGFSFGFTDAFFETVSGFTTTGASVVPNVEDLPRSLLFWRSFTQWLGGMGIVALFVAILPVLGVGGNFLFQAETPGPISDKIKPRISQTAKILWTIYFGMTVLLVLGLWSTQWIPGGRGMTLFEAICHSMTTVSTGGFSTCARSLGAFHWLAQWLVTAFMFASGVNFTVHYLFLSGAWRRGLANPELRLYLTIGAVSVALVAVSLGLASSKYGDEAVPRGLEATLRHAAFQVGSVMTTTGFCSMDFERWPDFARVLLVVLMFGGACGGSTAGGIKVARLLLGWLYTRREFQRLRHPTAVLPVKVSGRPVPEPALSSTMAFLVVYVLLYGLGLVLLLALGERSVTAVTASIACLSNIGPGLGEVGPMGNFAGISAAGKWILCALMLLGRLELFAVLLLFSPRTWRR